MTWNKCNNCGKFVSYDDFDSGLACRIMVSCDSYYSNEEYETLCAECYPKEVTKEEIDQHRDDVDQLLYWVYRKIYERSKQHDLSKYSDEEFPELVELTKHKILYGDVSYDSKEYENRKKILENMLKHHYENNRHHPEHFENGVDDMTLIDVIEMFVDWYAAAYRRNNGVLNLQHVCEKYNINEQLEKIFKNTIDEIAKDEPRFKIKVTQ